jgi:hypothetical protein
MVPVVALALLAVPACATTPEREGPVPLAAGDRVRVTLASRVATGRLQGTVVSVSPDTLVVAREEGGERRLSRAQIEEIEISMSRREEGVKAAGYGFLAAAPLLVIPVIFIILEPQVGAAALGYVLLPAAGAAVLGAVIGSGPQDAWVPAVWSFTSSPAPAESVPAEVQ